MYARARTTRAKNLYVPRNRTCLGSPAPSKWRREEEEEGILRPDSDERTAAWVEAYRLEWADYFSGEVCVCVCVLAWVHEYMRYGLFYGMMMSGGGGCCSAAR